LRFAWKSFGHNGNYIGFLPGALHLAGFFGTAVEFRISLQEHYELEVAWGKLGERLERKAGVMGMGR